MSSSIICPPFIALAILLVTPTISSPANAERLIVGWWTLKPGSCRHRIALAIRAMGLTDDKLECRFDGITQAGDVVVWTGKRATMDEGTSITAATV